MSDVDRGRPTLILNDEDYQKLESILKKRILFPNMVLTLKVKMIYQN